MKVAKTKMTFTFLHPADDDPAPMTPRQIFDECDVGGFVGSWGAEPMVTVEVPEDKVKEELLALGNDGDFFDMFEEQD